MRFDLQNIVGIPRPVENSFSDDSRLIPAIQKFLEVPLKHELPTTDNTFNSYGETPYTIKLPVQKLAELTYSMIYKDSESEEEYDEEIELVETNEYKKLLFCEKNGKTTEKNEIKTFSKQKSRITKAASINNYNPTRNDAMLTPCNTIDEGYEADSD